ncbi:MAG: hypothetical protein RIF34_01525 [Candidatus Kapaibacterium sp.]
MNQNLTKYILAFVIISAFAIISACSNTVQSSSDLRFPEEDGEEVSFFKHVKPFMQYTCATAACHDDFTQAGGISLTEYYTYFQSSSIGLVVRGNPDASRLIQIIEGKDIHLFIYNRELPTKNQQAGMRRWVLNGAPNN